MKAILRVGRTMEKKIGVVDIWAFLAKFRHSLVEVEDGFRPTSGAWLPRYSVLCSATEYRVDGFVNALN